MEGRESENFVLHDLQLNLGINYTSYTRNTTLMHLMHLKGELR